MYNVGDIAIDEYNYELPTERIALHPLTERDASKLLIVKNKLLTESTYANLATYIPEGALMIFNNTKVINARLLFTKASGATIEIFILEPHLVDITTAMQLKDTVTVKCFIGGASKWPKGKPLQKEININKQPILIQAHIEEQVREAFIVNLQWNGGIRFFQLLEAAGKIPLPPYIKRATDDEDTVRYQTMYALHNGSVAAPTAGLHFTEKIMQDLIAKNIACSYVTLHVGAGTFKPVTSATMQHHIMHAEYIEVTIELIEKLITHHNLVVAVGTTSVRTIESLYWMGAKVMQNPAITIATIALTQWEAYQLTNVPKAEALKSLLQWMHKWGITTLTTTTHLLIAPSYNYKIVNAIVTNFHQPKSTLLLLVAAATNNQWRTMYNYALQNDFRFLSYGDGSLIFINED